MRVAIVILLSIAMGHAALACEVGPVEPVRIDQVLSTTEYVLTDGRTLRLEGLGPPQAPADHRGAWPFGEDARAEVQALLRRQSISIAPLEETDRYDRMIARVWLEDGTWLGGDLISRGLARVETLPGEVRCARDLLTREAEARAAARGMWSLAAFDVLSPAESAAFTDDFQIVEGVVQAATEVRGRIYLNFGPDWRTDFTVTIAPRDARRFAGVGVNPLDWSGRRLRVRGWLSWYNGPQIEVDHIEQIEFLDEEG